MTESPRDNRTRRQSSRRGSVVPQTPDVLKHRPYKSYERTHSTQSKQNSARTLTTQSLSNKWYSSGYPALRAADKKIREIKARQESKKLKGPTQPNRRSRSYSRGRSVFFNDDDPAIPYYKSKSVESFRTGSSTFDPVVNERDVINLTYTGRVSRENTESRVSGSSRRGSLSCRRGSGIVQKKVESVVPHMRRNYDLDDLQTRIYQQIHKIYGEPDADLKNKQFFLTLAQIQSEHVRMKHLKMSKSDRMFLEKMFQEMTNIKKETGKILRNSTHRYSTQFEYPSPVNDKVRRVPRGRQDENFLTKMPRTRDKLKLKPIRHDMHAKNHKYHDKYEHFEKYNQWAISREMDQFQKVKEPDNPPEMLKFLQQAERFLTEYSKGLQTNSEKVYESGLTHSDGYPRTSRHHVLKPLYNRQSPSSYHKVKQKYGWTSPQKQIRISRNSPTFVSKPDAPIYKRPETFYDARKHMQFQSLGRLLHHRLNEAKHSGDISARSHGNSLRGLAT